MACADYDARRWDATLEPVRQIARPRGLLPLVAQSRAGWERGMATADLYCLTYAAALVAPRRERLEALIRAVPLR
ncbi:hypothetical protein OMW55_06990 [Sphingomonas sp. BN140010]|uniref:Uncharacterized protein n=1 Tax=Sphingomonas arvum TaxID=2992113 RepID=A0ABT3JFG5_9SPHN|nr:hypothetical protein [Sphingomonas sp. BN140010]MCW3797546.1 hypothetical protein [Sphingomonas sp. BN140010]